MSGLLVWAAIVGVGWWWAIRPARHTRQDRLDIARVRAAQRRVLR